MANQYSTETELRELEALIDVTDELDSINQAFDCYHGLISCYLRQNAEITLPPAAASRFLNGTNVIFYSILSRLERIQKAVQQYDIQSDN